MQEERVEDALPTLSTAELLPMRTDIVVGQLLSYLVGVLLGRYRLDTEGLHIAHPNATEEETASYTVNLYAMPFSVEIDQDNIVPIMGSACSFPDDIVRRVEDIIHHIWGDSSFTENINFIQRSLGKSMEKWLVEDFWAYHNKNYQKKPIYWLFCSNPKKPKQSAFRVLSYMHRMDAFTIQKIMRQYLHPHQESIRKEYEELLKREASLSKEEKKKLDAMPSVISELKEYNELLKSYADQQIVLDLDEGVTNNYERLKGIVAVIK